MSRRKLAELSDAEVWERWRADMERIKHEAYELFASRRTFREVSEVFMANRRLRDIGGHLWRLIRASYADFVVMRIRRETDDQGNTISLTRLMIEITERPEVITRQRYMDMLDLPIGSHLIDVNQRYFSETWAPGREPRPETSVDPTVVRNNRRELDRATERVQEVGNLSVAHRQRVEVGELQVPEVEGAFEAIETMIQKYYVLLHGSFIAQLEPTPQFDTLEVFTFPWMEAAP